MNLPEPGPSAPPSGPSAPPAPSERAAMVANARQAPPRGARPRRQHAHNPKRARAQRIAVRRAAVERRERAYLERLTARVKAAGGDGVQIRAIPQRVWTMCHQIMADPTGRAARIHLRDCRSRIAAGRVLEWAAEHTWSSLRVRREACAVAALAALGRHTRRRGPWGMIVKGLARGAFCALLRDPFDTRRPSMTREQCAADRGVKEPELHSCQRCRAPGIPSVTALFGTHKPGADPLGSDVGYFVNLAALGIVYSQQLPAGQVDASEIGPRGHALNRYWLPAETPTAIYDPAERAAAWEAIEAAERDARRLALQLLRERLPPSDPRELYRDGPPPDPGEPPLVGA